MNIVELIPELSSGGAERFVVDLANELGKRNIVYLIVSYPLKREYAFYLSDLSDRIKVYSLNKKKGFDFGYQWRLYKLLKHLSPDVVHTHIDTFMHIALMKWILPKFIFVHTIHSDAPYEAGGKIKAFFKKCFFRREWCKATTISHISDKSFKEFYGAPSTLIFNGRAPFVKTANFNTPLIPPKDNSYNFVSIGHISETKNHMLMCQAISNLVAKGAPIDLYIFGRVVSPEIAAQIESLKCLHIHLLGEVTNPRLHLVHADVFCMSSIIEGMPISLIEALSCGLIPICTPVGGIVDVVKEGYNGFLSDNLTLPSFTATIQRFLDLSISERRQLKKNALESSKQYTIEYCASQYINLFEQSQNKHT